ncbi:MAG: hypothetical protein HYY37_05950 [Candidatus Aenigmarchaeota archaeon]|nr:hypothetical protein [Candidatus Aenigmarchaeota archaeon]
MSSHADALLVTCIDFRFWEKVSNVVKSLYKIQTMDIISFPGGVKSIVDDGVHSPVLENIRLSVTLHSVDKIVLVNHRDCGAYGGSGAFADREGELDTHFNDLEAAKDILHREFPEKEIIISFADMKSGMVDIVKEHQ